MDICEKVNTTVFSLYHREKYLKLKMILFVIQQWELINIEEGGESGEILKSELRVPSSPSFCLQAVLNDIAALIGHAAVPK